MMSLVRSYVNLYVIFYCNFGYCDAGYYYVAPLELWVLMAGFYIVMQAIIVPLLWSYLMDA
jgi:hypothetical protein